MLQLLLLKNKIKIRSNPSTHLRLKKNHDRISHAIEVHILYMMKSQFTFHTIS